MTLELLLTLRLKMMEVPLLMLLLLANYTTLRMNGSLFSGTTKISLLNHSSSLMELLLLTIYKATDCLYLWDLTNLRISLLLSLRSVLKLPSYYKIMEVKLTVWNINMALAGRTELSLHTMITMHPSTPCIVTSLLIECLSELYLDNRHTLTKLIKQLELLSKTSTLSPIRSISMASSSLT